MHSDWFILPLLLPTPTIWFSLDHKRNVSEGVGSGVGRKWKRSDSSGSDSVVLMTPLTTPIFDFDKVISALTFTTSLTTLTPTPSLVKTSLRDLDKKGFGRHHGDFVLAMSPLRLYTYLT